jgi:hypothetical protein
VPNVYVADVTNGYPLYGLNESAQFNYPASTTKLMTGYLTALFVADGAVSLSTTFTVNSADLTFDVSGASVCGLEVGDVVSVRDLLYGLFLASGSDAAQVLARNLGSDGSGTGGQAGFVTLMNATAGTFGLSNSTVYFDPWGGSQTNSPTVIRNQTTARDLSVVLTRAMAVDARLLRTISTTTTHNMTVTGPNARTISLSSDMFWFNGPVLNPAGGTDPTVLGCKLGGWTFGSGAANNWNSMATLWRSPAGYEVAICTLGSGSPTGTSPQNTYAMSLDQRGLMYQLLKDFPYLSDGYAVGTDPNWTAVQVLCGFDGAIVDESSVRNTIVVSGSTVGPPVVRSTGGLDVGADTDLVTIANYAGVQVGSGNMTVEVWYAGPGLRPTTATGEIIFLSKQNVTSGAREWLVEEFTGLFEIWASADGSSWTAETTAFNIGTDANTFYNGAPRHIAWVKNGSTWTLYINGDAMGGTLNVATAGSSAAPLGIASVTGASVAAVGAADEYRATFGAARYTTAMFSIYALKFPRS